MKRITWAKLIVCFSLITCILATSIDWSFLDASADEETVLDEADAALDEESAVLDKVNVPEDEMDMPDKESVPNEEAVPDGEITPDEESNPDAPVEDIETPVTNMETTEMPAEKITALTAETDGYKAVYTLESGFPADTSVSLLVLTDDEINDLMTKLAPQDEIPVTGFIFDVQTNGVSITDTVEVELSCPTADGMKLYRYADEVFESVDFAVGEDKIGFSFAGNDTYLITVPDPKASTYADTEAAYAISYEDGTLVFQRGNTPDPERGPVNWTYAVSETAVYNRKEQVPWHLAQATSVVFEDVIRPVSTAYWFSGFKRCTSFDLALLDTSAVTSMDCMFMSVQSCDVLDLSSFDTSSVTSMTKMFELANGISTLDLSSFDTSSVTNMYSMFENANGISTLDLSSFNTSSVTNMSRMFYGCGALRSLDLSSFDTSNVKNIGAMFYDCEALHSLDLSSFDTSNVTDMANMFYGCKALSSLDLSSFDTSNVTNMANMFYGCKALNSLDLSSFNTSNVTNMCWMFSGCEALSSLDLSSFDTSNVTNMDWMFSGCEVLSSLDLSSFNTLGVERMRQMFGGCEALQFLDLSSFDTLFVTDMSRMFQDCKSLLSLDLSSFDTSSVTNMSYMFDNCNNLSSLDLSSFDTSKVTAMIYMFSGCHNLLSLELSSFDTQFVRDMSYMFDNCQSLVSLDLSSFDTPSVTNMSYMFQDCKSLLSLDLSSFDTSSVVTMLLMFSNCDSLTTLDLSSFDTSSVKSMNGMFNSCDSLTALDLSSFDTSSVTDMARLFLNCVNLRSLDISSFDTSSVTSLYCTFDGCKGLTALDLSNFDTSNVTTMYRMFNSCKGLTALDLSNFDFSKVVTVSYMFYDCDSLRSLTIPSLKISSNVNIASMLRTPQLNLMVINPKLLKKGCFTHTIFKAPWYHLETGTRYENFYESFDPDAMAFGTYVKAIPITFDPIYGTSSSINSYIGNTVEELPEPPVSSYRHFVGWFTEKEGGEQLLPGGTITTDAYYAHWTDYQYELILKPNGGDGQDLIYQHNYHDIYQLPGAAFTWPGKTLSGWNTRKDGSGESYVPTDFIRGLTTDEGGTFILYAQWSDPLDLVTVSFETNGGLELQPQTVPRNTTINVRTPSKEGYTFYRWTTDAGGKNPLSSSGQYNATEDVTLYAWWHKNPTVTFSMNGIGTGFSKTIPYNEAIGTLPACPPYSNRYMSLVGWFTQAEGGTPVSSTLRVREDITIYAHWGWAPKFNTTGGKITTDDNFPIQEGSSVYTIETLPTAVRDGYTFTGWYWGNEKLSDGCSIDLSKGIDIEARWERSDVVTVTFDPNGGKINSSTSAYKVMHFKGQPLTGFPTATATGKYVAGYGTTYPDFAGWMDEDENFYEPGASFDADITLTAQWQLKDVILTFDPDGGSAAAGTGVTSGKMCVPSGTTLFTLPGSKKANYILEGWYTEKNGQGEKLTTETIHTESRTWYANWESFFLNGSDETSLYVYGAEWSNASNTSATNRENTLEWHPTGSSSITSSLHIRFELNKSTESGEDLTLPVGAVKIRIPRYIWQKHDGAPVGSNNISSNFPKYPAVKNGMWFSYMEDGDDYILINSKELSGTAGLDCTINYTLSSSDLKYVDGGASDINGRYLPEYKFFKNIIPVEFSIDNNLDGSLESHMTKDLNLEFHTMGSFKPSKTESNVYYEWQPNWGEPPKDADSYFYIQWKIQHNKTGIQSFQSFTLRENSVHDGTVLDDYETLDFGASSNVYVYTKHPMSLLKDAPASGLVIENTAFVTGVLQSGYTTTLPVYGKTTVYKAEYPTGEYTKTNTNGSGSVQVINDGQETILDDNEAEDLKWRISYSGGSNTAPVWDEELGTYKADKRTIRIRDGAPGDVLYSSGSASAKYVWEPDTKNVVLTDNDYEFDSYYITITQYDAQFVDGAWTLPLSVPVTSNYDLYIRQAGSSEFVYWSTLEAIRENSNRYYLPDDTVGIEIRTDSDYYKVDVNIQLTMKLKPTNHVRMLLRDDVNKKTSSIIKNGAVCDIWNTEKGENSTFFHAQDNLGGNNPANKNAYELKVSKLTQYTGKAAASQTNVIFDVERGTQDTPMWIGAYNYNNSGRKKRMDAGVFYDLLPEGTSVDPATVFGRLMTMNYNNITGSPDNYNTIGDKIDPGYYDVRFVQNWEGSGRTMMIIKYGLPKTDTTPTGINFYYLLHNTYENVMEHGTVVENDVAFVNLTENQNPPNGIAGQLSTITEKGYYQSLEDQYSGNIGYAKANTHYIPIDAYSWGFNKSVQTVSEFEYLGETLPNNTYTYRLVYSQSEYATSRSLVFFDVLEGGSDTKGEDGSVQHNESEWHGEFLYVNTGAASEKLTDGSTTIHCKPVIYYSTKDRNSFTGSDWDVTNSETWTSEKPADNALITAVAVDCSKNEDGSDFVMKGKQSLEMFITMRAPKDPANAGKTAYNEGVIWARHENDEEPTPQYDNAAVRIQDVDPEIHKTSDPESGSEEEPAEVFEGDGLTYTVSVTNTSDAFTINDVVVKDKAPDGLNVDYSNISVHFGDPANALKVSMSPRVSMTRNVRDFTFTISSLLPGETVYIEIPSVVAVDRGLLVNTAHLTSMNGVEKQIDSETTYHEAQPTGMAVKKMGAYGGLAGAKMQLLDLDGNVVHEWISSAKTEHFEVKPGDYIVHEAEVPAGYFPAEDIPVHLSRTGVLTVDDVEVPYVEMFDEYTSVVLEKITPDGSSLGGAKMAVYLASDMTGHEPNEGAEPVVRFVTTEDGAHELNGVLLPGQTYVLVEEEAPEGYRIAEPIPFTVPSEPDVVYVTMTDLKDWAIVPIVKLDPEYELLPGATLCVRRLIDGTDEIDETFTEITWVSKDTAEEVKLAPGTYVLHESKAPEGYGLARDVKFTVDVDGSILIDGYAYEEVRLMDPFGSYELYVTKYVKGNMGDLTRQFNFRLTLTKSEIAEVPSSIEYVKDVETQGTDDAEPLERGTLTLTNGSCEFTLADLEFMAFTVPNGVSYTIEELDGEDLGYEVTCSNSSGQINGKGESCWFMNTKESTVPTGFSAMTGAAVMLPVVSGLGILFFIKKKRPKKED